METNAPNYLNFTLTTPRLILKKADASDLPDIYHNLWRHAESARYMLWEATRSTAEAEDRLRRSIAFQKEHKYAFFVREKATGKTIGFAGMKEVAPGVFEDCGIALGPDYTGKGYGTEILTALIDEARACGAQKFIGTCRKQNIASHNLMRRCGLTFTHDEERTDPRDGTPYVLEFHEIVFGGFWDRSWNAFDLTRARGYAEKIGAQRDVIADFLKDRGARRVCDAGCGCGAYALKLARGGLAVSGFDIAENAVCLAKTLLAENGYAAEFRKADILSTGYPSDCFDAVVARDVVDHMPIGDGARAVAELLRIVRSGGCVLLTLDAADAEYEAEPHEVSEDGDYLFTAGKWNGMVFHSYSPREIEKLLAGQNGKLLSASENGCVVALEKA